MRKLTAIAIALAAGTAGAQTIETECLGNCHYPNVQVITRMGQPPTTVIRTPMGGGVEHLTVVPGEDQGMRSWGGRTAEEAWGHISEPADGIEGGYGYGQY